MSDLPYRSPISNSHIDLPIISCHFVYPALSSGGVIEVDLYNCGSVIGRSDDELVSAALEDILRGCVPGAVPPGTKAGAYTRPSVSTA
jgi:hypothetical protein